MIPADAGFRVTSGTPKTIAKTADTGSVITSHFCGDCGSTLFRTSDTFGPGVCALKVGAMDDLDALDDARPTVELFAGHRVAWIPEISGTTKLPGMP